MHMCMCKCVCGYAYICKCVYVGMRALAARDYVCVDMY